MTLAPIVVRVEAPDTALPPVEYRWDADTDILTAALRWKTKGDGMSGSVEVQGDDGSWLILDVSGGRIGGVEVAVWPEVRKVSTLAPPADATPARVTIPSRPSQPGIAAVEVDTRLAAVADQAERTIHFRLGAARVAQSVRVAADIVLDIDEGGHLAGVWLLNVPPFPGEQ